MHFIIYYLDQEPFFGSRYVTVQMIKKKKQLFDIKIFDIFDIK